MEDSVLLGVYGLVFFGSAYFCPRNLNRLACILGYTSYVIFGGLLFSIAVPEVGQMMLLILNSGVKALWGMTE